MDRRNFYAKLIVSLIISFLLVTFMEKHVFLANSPIVRPNLPQYLATFVKYSVSSRTRVVTDLFNKAPVTTGQIQVSVGEAIRVPAQIVGKGIYAKEDGENSQILIREDEVDWTGSVFEIGGRMVKLQTPVGEAAPEKSAVEKIF